MKGNLSRVGNGFWTVGVRWFALFILGAQGVGTDALEAQPLDGTNLSVQDGLIAYWPFSGNTLDSGPNGHHGTNQGAVWAEDRYGNSASALDFLAGPSAVYVDSNPFDTVPESLTLSLWANPRSWDMTIQQFLFYLKDSDPNLQFLILGFRDGIFKFESGNYTATYPEADIALNQWHHFALTWDGAIISGYLDGRFVASVPAPSVSPGSGRANPIITIGRNQEFESTGFDGRIDDIALYDRALSSREIEELAFQADWVVPSLGMEMIGVDSGTFLMGSPETEVGRLSDEGPLTEVTISRPFWIGKYEVTQAEWGELMEGNPSRTVGERIAVHKVNWYSATLYCEMLTQIERDAGRLPEGYVYRLPTEAEWEYAVRAGNQSRFFYGDDPGYVALPNYAWYLPNQDDRVHEVGQKLPNPRGLYDVYGNVPEWCFNWWSESLPGGTVVDPVGPLTGTKRGVRGGHRGNGGDRLRSAWRLGAQHPHDIGLNFGYGFRVVLAPELAVDQTPPTLTCPEEWTIALDGNCSTVVPDLIPHVSMADDVTPAESLITRQFPPSGTVIGEGETVVQLEVEDEAGNVSACDVLVIVGDASPPVLVCENPAVTAANDQCLAAVPAIAYEVSDNCGEQSVTVVQDPAPGTWVSLGRHDVVVTATDLAGNQTSCRVDFWVVDLTAPSIVNLVGPSEPLAVGQEVTFSAEVSDNCALAGAEWDWGDGTSSTQSLLGGSYGLVETHAYSNPGVYTVVLRVADESGHLTHSSFQYVVIYDPEGGFVTGGGQIDSPTGAYRWDSAASGIANFGFVAKYHQGAMAPSGQTSFRFRNGGFNFKATIYDWLVVAGPNAKYKGSGMVNGEEGFSFMLTATDGDRIGGGQDDTLRLKVWDSESGEVVYDNLDGEADDSDLGQAIHRGNIVIHKP